MTRFRRAGLITLAVLSTLALACLAVLGVSAFSFWRTLDAYTEATGTSTAIQYLDQSDMPRGGNVVSIRRAPPRVLAPLLGDYLIAAFATVERISLRQARSAALERAASFQGLEVLHLVEVPVTEEALLRIAKNCGRLTSVAFTSTGVDDDSLCLFADLPKLESISLIDESSVSPNGICCFAEHPAIEHATLWSVDGLHNAEQCLSRFSLKTATLAGPEFGDADVAALSESGSLLSLKLIGTGITDEAIGSIQGSPNLAELWISESPITLDALDGLGNLPELRMLVLRNTGLPPEHIDRLRMLLPKTKILVGGSDKPHGRVRNGSR